MDGGRGIAAWNLGAGMQRHFLRCDGPAYAQPGAAASAYHGPNLDSGTAWHDGGNHRHSHRRVRSRLLDTNPHRLQHRLHHRLPAAVRYSVERGVDRAAVGWAPHPNATHLTTPKPTGRGRLGVVQRSRIFRSIGIAWFVLTLAAIAYATDRKSTR